MGWTWVNLTLLLYSTLAHWFHPFLTTLPNPRALELGALGRPSVCFRCQGEFDATLFPRPALLHESWRFGEGLEETLHLWSHQIGQCNSLLIFFWHKIVFLIYFLDFSGTYIDFTDRFLGTSCEFFCSCACLENSWAGWWLDSQIYWARGFQGSLRAKGIFSLHACRDMIPLES